MPRRWEARMLNGPRVTVGTRGHYLGHHTGRFPAIGAHVLEAEAEPPARSSAGTTLDNRSASRRIASGPENIREPTLSRDPTL